MSNTEQLYHRQETAKEYTKKYTLDSADEMVVKQEDGMLGYISAGQFATTGSNIFDGGQVILGNLNIDGDIIANQFLVTTMSVTHYSASTNFGLDDGDTHRFTGSVRITGSLNTIGTTTMTGSFLVSGSTTQIGDNTLLGNTQLYGTIDVSGSTNFHNHTITMTGSMYTSGSQTITGSLDIKGNVNVASGSEFYLHGNKLFNYGQFSDTTTQSGSANTAYAKRLNTTDFAHEVSVVSGSRITVANTGIYNLQFSSQLENTANSNITFDIWLAYTGSNVVNSNTQIDVTKVTGLLGKQVAAWNFMLPIQANDYVELMWSCNSSTGQLHASGVQSNPTRPAIPSVIATLTQIG
jgi:hypothetical protein